MRGGTAASGFGIHFAVGDLASRMGEELDQLIIHTQYVVFP